MNNQMNHIASKLSCGLLGGVSVLALSLAGPAMAQDTQTMETVTVTGQRAAIQSALRIKENADQIVDSIVADDAGKLPDRSITEVLQRVSGVTITHFSNPGAPDDYTVEGSAPTVRGLPGGASTINGHNAFSANGGRNILWGDVPSELMAAVDVFKTYTPDQIEGGLGGSINLRTKLPFDFDGTKIGGRIGISYGDLVKQARPVGSAMISTRWDTKIGEMGLLVSLSYDDNSYRNDSIQVGAYYPHTNVIDNYSLDTSNPAAPKAKLKNQFDPAYQTALAADPTTPYWYDPNGRLTTYFLPGGFDYHTTTASHQRGGGNIAFQWRPSDKLLIHARAFSSVNESNSHSYSYSADAGSEWANITYVTDPTSSSSSTQGAGDLLTALTSPAPTSTDALYHVWDSGNYLLKSNSYVNPQDINSCNQPGKLCSSAITRSTASKQFSRTTDVEVGADWAPNDNWQVRTAVDFIYSKSNFTSLQLEGRAIMPNYGVDMSGNYPTFIFKDASALRTSSSYYWYDTMKDKNKNYGQEAQANIDVTYHLNQGIFKDIKFGWRGDVRTEHDHDTGYYWQALSPNWVSPQYYWSESRAVKDTVLYQFPNFFRGEVNLPGQALFVDASKVATLDDAYFQNQYAPQHNPAETTKYTGPYTSKDFSPYDAKRFKTVNVAAYAMVTFAKDSVFGMPLSGNAGARLVYVDNQASGYFQANNVIKFRVDKDGPLWATDSMAVPIAGGRVSWTLLPAFNVQIMPTDQIHVRLAGSITAQQPNFAGIYGSYSVSTQTDAAGASSPLYNPPNPAYDPAHPKTVNVVNGFNFEGDNPRIKPEIGRNLDLSFEWYGSGRGDSLHLSLFYKSIKHKTTKAVEMRDLTWNIGIPDPNAANDDCLQVNYLCTFTTNGSQNVVIPTVTKTTVNSNKEAVIRGFEVGFNKYFEWDFVPSYLKGFGFAGNYTYIDSKAPGSYSLDMFGNNLANHLPMEGLSHHSANAQLMYDREPISFRLAYNWRNKYLLLASGYNTGGNYLGANSGITCHQNNTAAGGWGGNIQEGYCYYSLPVWSKAFGSLDAGLDYSIDDNWKLSIQSQNLLNTKAKTTMGVNMAAYTDATGVARPAQQERSRNWFVADRRVSIDLRVNF